MIDIQFFATGYCEQSHTFVFPKEKPKRVRFYAFYALLRHPNAGYLLFDTGYSLRNHEAAKHFPYSLYEKLVPVQIESIDIAVRQLEHQSIGADEIKHIFVSHFHADHIGGLKDFPKARFICSSSAFTDVKNKRGFAAVRRGFLPDLLPDKFMERCRFLNDADFVAMPDSYTPFHQGVDIFGDGSVWAVRLEGHARGHMGLFVKANTREYFLIADAAWHSRALREGILPRQTVRLFMSSWKDYVETFAKIRSLQLRRPEIMIIASHCSEVYEAFINQGRRT
jgi:glyoxylase-like metal-dependent hydrolase (beta-lactamase superfamily II)